MCAWLCSGSSNGELISKLRSQGLVTSHRVATAMLAVDRANYCPSSSSSSSSSSQRSAYQDSPQTIGYSATISAPHMHAYAAEALLPFLTRDSNAVLDIGSGSGYLTAIFHHLINQPQSSTAAAAAAAAAVEAGSSSEGATGSLAGGQRPPPGHSRVIGIDHLQPLVDLGLSNLQKDGLSTALSQGHIQVVLGDGRKGWPARAPYNAIHVGAASPPHVIDVLVEQLARPGRLFIPVEDPKTGQQDIWHIDKDVDGNVKREKVLPVRYVPLTDARQQWDGGE